MLLSNPYELEDEDQKGAFYSCASIFGIGEGNRGNGTFRFGVTYTVATSRCPTAFLLFTRLLYAISRCTYGIRRATLFVLFPLCPLGRPAASFARVRCEECDTPRFTTLRVGGLEGEERILE